MMTTMPALARGPFSWSGTFPYPATSTANLIKYLGIDGSVSPDISGDTHLWQMEATLAVDTGSLAASQFNFNSIVDVTSVTDASFGLGARNINLVGTNFTTAGMATPAGVYPLPSAMNGTVSFLVGGLVQIDSMPGSQTFANIVNKATATGNGWMVRARDASFGGYDVGYLQLVLIENNFAITTTVGTNAPLDAAPLVGVDFGEPFAFLCGVDIAAGNIFMMISKAASLAETAWSDGGTFDSANDPVRVGRSNLFGLEHSYNGLIGQLFTAEWSASLDAGITEDNMANFLMFCDGYLRP